MKIKHLKVASILLAATLVTSSCAGSWSLFNKLADWNSHATSSKIVNGILGWILLPTGYPICGLIDTFVLNTIEFWSGENPMAKRDGKIQNVMGQDGRYYAVKTLKDGYEITKPDGEMLKFIYDKATDSWSMVQNGEIKEMFRFNHDGTIKVTTPNGDKMDVALDNTGIYQMRMAANNGLYFL